MVLFDSIDHYLCNYLLLLMGILQCFGCGWAFDYEVPAKKSEQLGKSVNFLAAFYWISLLVHGVWGIFAEIGLIGMVVFFGTVLFIALPISYFIAGTNFDVWYKFCFMNGVRRIGYSISKLGRDDVEDANGE